MVLLETSEFGPSATQPLCQICRKHAAKYTCPSCNLRYCSIDCFRSENHVNCSEAFYKNSIVNDVRDREDVDPAEKAKMLEMLKRIQDMGNDELDDSEDESEQDALAALEGLDLDNLTPEEMLKYLSPEQRREFEEMLADPTKAADLLELEDEHRSCWWLEDSKELEREPKKTARKPTPLPQAKLLKPSTTAIALQYNLLTILVAYALVIRVHGSDSQLVEKQAMLLSLLPYIGEKSTLVLTSVNEAVDYVLGNIPGDLITDERKLLLFLLTDLLNLLYKPKISVLEEGENSLDPAYLALSDAHAILSSRDSASQRTASRSAAQKVLYYASNLENYDRERLQAEVSKRRRRMEIEDEERSQFAHEVLDRKNIAHERLAKDKGMPNLGPTIEEIG